MKRTQPAILRAGAVLVIGSLFLGGCHAHTHHSNAAHLHDHDVDLYEEDHDHWVPPGHRD